MIVVQVNQLIAQGKYDGAVNVCKKTLENVEKAHGNQCADYATVLNFCMIVYKQVLQRFYQC